MAGLELDLDANFSPLANVFSQLEKIPDDLSAPMDEIGQVLVFAAQYNIRQSVDFEGNPLEPLAESTRAKRGEDARPLLDFGNLRDSYTHIFDHNSVEVGSDAIQAALMHFGGRAGRNHAAVIPARPALGVSPDDEIEIVNIMRDFVIDEVNL